MNMSMISRGLRSDADELMAITLPYAQPGNGKTLLSGS